MNHFHHIYYKTLRFPSTMQTFRYEVCKPTGTEKAIWCVVKNVPTQSLLSPTFQQL